MAAFTSVMDGIILCMMRENNEGFTKIYHIKCN